MNFEQALQQLPAPGHGCHPALLAAANIGILSGITPEEVFSSIKSAIPQGDRAVTDREIRDAVAKAAAECHPDPAGMRRMRYTVPAVPSPSIDGDKVLQAILKRGDGAEDVDLWELSPVRPDHPSGAHDAVLVLESLFAPDDYIVVGSHKATRPQRMSAVLEEIHRRGAVWPFVCINPVDGQAHDIADHKSTRCDKAVANFNHVLIEHDTMLLPAQMAFWYTVCRERLLDVATLVYSGGKSIHAWVRLGAKDYDDYKIRREKLKQIFNPMGFDSSTWNPSRLSRLAGHAREDKGGNVQRLLYLNPDRRTQATPPPPAPRKTSQDAPQSVARPSAWNDEDSILRELSQ
jgi:hypothetical protein